MSLNTLTPREVEQPQTADPVEELALLKGQMVQLCAALRRGLKQELAAVEEFCGIDGKMCKHCGRPVG